MLKPNQDYVHNILVATHAKVSSRGQGDGCCHGTTSCGQFNV